jgi:hypothetical protein
MEDRGLLCDDLIATRSTAEHRVQLLFLSNCCWWGLEAGHLEGSLVLALHQDSSVSTLPWVTPPSSVRKGKGKGHPVTGHEGPEVELRYNSILSLTSALDAVGGQRYAPAALPQDRPGAHCTGGWVGPSADLDGCGKFRPNRDSIPGPYSP